MFIYTKVLQMPQRHKTTAMEARLLWVISDDILDIVDRNIVFDDGVHSTQIMNHKTLPVNPVILPSVKACIHT